jgi:hypothetical protein
LPLAPEGEPIPEEYRGAPVIVIMGRWCGSLGEGERATQPLREIATPIADLSGAMSFVAAQQLFDADYFSGGRYYWKSLYLRELDEANIAWVRRRYDDATRFASGGTYFNFAGFLEGGEELLAQSFGANYPRIREIKAKYDPENIFHHNLGIPVRQRSVKGPEEVQRSRIS